MENGNEKKETEELPEKPEDVEQKFRKAVIRQRVIIGILTGVLVVGGVGAVGYKLGWFGGQKEDLQSSADIDPNAEKWDGQTPKSPEKSQEEDTIAVPGYPQIYLPAGQTEVEVAFFNPEDNPCYFTFQLVLKEGEEILYESKQVPPGEAVTKATLRRALEAGEYPAVLKIATASTTDLSPMNGANMETVLQVQ